VTVTLPSEAPLSTARDSTKGPDFALACLFGLFGLRIFEGCSANVGDLGRCTATGVDGPGQRSGKTVLIPSADRTADEPRLTTIRAAPGRDLQAGDRPAAVRASRGSC